MYSLRSREVDPNEDTERPTHTASPVYRPSEAERSIRTRILKVISLRYMDRARSGSREVDPNEDTESGLGAARRRGRCAEAERSIRTRILKDCLSIWRE